MEPERINNSKWITPDVLTEQMYGAEGMVLLREVRLLVSGGRSASLDTDKGPEAIPIIALGGSAAGFDPTNGDGFWQMWECELLIRPRRKFRKGSSGWRIDQLMCSDFANPERWEELIWEAEGG
jgi:hypothetical protein